MNKIEVKEKVNGKVEKHFLQGNKTFLFQSDKSFELTFELPPNQTIEVFHYAKDCSGKIKVFLKGENAHLLYHYNTISENDNQVEMNVFHEAKKTKSELFFHGYNTAQKKLNFEVNVYLPKGMTDSVANQENRIYNRQNGASQILPNLYVDEYSVSANHASYIGPFDENMKFYMQTRGLKKEVIERMLLEALLIGEGLTEDEKTAFFQIRKEG